MFSELHRTVVTTALTLLVACGGGTGPNRTAETGDTIEIESIKQVMEDGVTRGGPGYVLRRELNSGIPCLRVDQNHGEPVSLSMIGAYISAKPGDELTFTYEYKPSKAFVGRVQAGILSANEGQAEGGAWNRFVPSTDEEYRELGNGWIGVSQVVPFVKDAGLVRIQFPSIQRLEGAVLIRNIEIRHKRK